MNNIDYGCCKYCEVVLEEESFNFCQCCKTRQCHNCVTSKPIGTDIELYCKKCNAYLGSSSGLFESDDDKSSYR